MLLDHLDLVYKGDGSMGETEVSSDASHVGPQMGPIPITPLNPCLRGLSTGHVSLHMQHTDAPFRHGGSKDHLKRSTYPLNQV